MYHTLLLSQGGRAGAAIIRLRVISIIESPFFSFILPDEIYVLRPEKEVEREQSRRIAQAIGPK